MAISWRLKTCLATQHGIHRATDLQRLIVKKTGVLISVQNLCRYLNQKPKEIRLSTLELICTSIGCDLKDFCEIRPKENLVFTEIKKLSWQNTPKAKRALKNFPDPKLYE